MGRLLRRAIAIAQPELGATLQRIAEQGRDGFYVGEVAEDVVEYLRSLGGFHTLEDFAAPQAEYVTPISTKYRGYDVVECPPNGQGLTALIMLNILSGFDLTDFAPMSVQRLHLECEAARLAYGVRDRFVADPDQADIPIEQLLSEDYAAQLRAKINLDKVMPPLEESDFPAHPDTVYLCVVDEEGNAISFINSVFHGFGSGLVSPKTGVVLQNRGAGFTLEGGASECDRAWEASAAHHYSWDADEGGSGSDAVWRDGRTVSADGTCALSYESVGLSDGCAAGA